MKFSLIDRVLELDSGKRIVAVKAVTLAEEYLADHFPTFPVLPGVLMLEALTEAGAWLVREAQDFVPGVILLRSAKNVTYKSFVKPGNLLRVEVNCRRMARDESEFTGCGYCDQNEVVRARFILRHMTVGSGEGECSHINLRLAAQAKAAFALLWP